MAMSVGEAVGSGFTLVARRPWAVIGWGFFIYLAMVVLVIVVFAVGGAATFAQLRPGTDPTAEAQAVGHLFATLWPMFLLFVLALLFVSAIVQAAVYRSVLEPDNRAYGSLRVGNQEAALFLLFLVFFLVAIACEVASLIVFVVLGLIGRAAGGGFAGGALVALLAIAWLLFLSYVLVRFSLAGPMTFVERRVRFFGSWEASRGEGMRLWGLFWVIVLVAFGCVIAYYILSLILGLVFVGMGMAAVGATGGLANLASNPGAFGASAPVFILYFLISIILGALFTGGMQAVLQAPFADAYRQLKGPPDVARTFS
jgi:hypothetical protein